MTRHELREQVFLLLFRVEFNSDEEMEQQIKLYLADQEAENGLFAEYPIAKGEDADYVTAKYEKIREKLPEIDAMLNDKAEGWSVSRMGKVELSILRLALYEMKYEDSVPEAVAINEAVEIAKAYGQDQSAAFINAILAKFATKSE